MNEHIMTHINFKTLEEYLQEHAQTDEQTNRMHNYFSTLLKSVKNHENTTENIFPAVFKHSP